MAYLSQDEINAGILNNYMSQGSNIPSNEERTFGGTLKDIGFSIGKGIVGTGQAAIGLADIVTPGQLGKAVEENVVDLNKAQEYLEEQYTPAQKAANARVEAAQGFLPTLGAMIQNPSTIGHAIVESAPSMVAGGFVGKGLLAANALRSGLAAGAIGEGAVTAGQTSENIRQQTPDKTLSLGQAGAAVGAGIGTSALGAIGGKIASKLGIGDIDTYLASRQLAETSNKGVIRRIVEGGISEGVFEEMPQSMQEQVWMNAATGKDLLEGVKEAGAAGLLTGAAMGSGVNVFTSSAKDHFNQDELNQLNKEQQDIKIAETQATTPEEQANVQARKEQFVDTLSQRKEAVELHQGISKTDEEIKNERQALYDQWWALPTEKSAQESAEAILAQKPYTDIEQAQKDRQRQIDNTYLPAEAEVDKINQYRLNEAQSKGEPTPVALRNTDLITRNGQPYQKRNYLEGLISELPNKNDYEIVETDNGFIGRLTDEALDVRKEQQVWQDERGIYQSEAAYWNAQQEAIRRQQETPLQTVMERSIPFEERLPRSNQEAIEDTYNEQERTVPEAPNVGSTSEQPVQQVANKEVTTPVEQEPKIEATQTKEEIREDFQARRDLISNMQAELEELNNRYEQKDYDLGEEDTLLTAIEDKQQEIKNANRELLLDMIDKRGQFEVRSDQEPGQGISLSSIQKMYPNQEIFQAADGKVSVKFKNGLGATFQDVQDIGNGYIQLAIDTGQMDKNGLILGITQGNQVMLHKDYADDRTLWHEKIGRAHV